MLSTFHNHDLKNPYVGECGLAAGLSRGKNGRRKKCERLVIHGMLINIHELSSLAFHSKNNVFVINCFIET